MIRHCAIAPAFTLLVVACFGCDRPAPPTTAEVERHLDYLDRSLEAVYAAGYRRSWQQFTGVEVVEQRVPGASLAFFDHDFFARWRRQVREPQLRRRVELGFRHSLVAAVRADSRVGELEERLSRGERERERVFETRSTTDAELARVYRRDPDRTRRQAAFMVDVVEPGHVASSDLAKLFRRRNARAHELGYANFYTLRLAVLGLDEGMIETLIARLDQGSEAAARNSAARLDRLAPDGRARPWDEEFALEPWLARVEPALDAESMLARMTATVAAIGLPITGLPIVIDSETRASRSQHFYTFPLAVPGDVRVLVTPATGFYAYRATAHELGHALHYAMQSERPYLSRLPESHVYAECVGKIFERLVYEPEWLQSYARVTAEDARRVREYVAADELMRMRRFLGAHRFERAAYLDPDQDLDLLFASTMTATTFIDWRGAGPAWASDLHYVTQPLANVEYLVARLVQAQFYEALAGRLGRLVDEPEFGAVIRDQWFAPGGTRSLGEVVEDTTGQPLAVGAYLRRELGLR